MKLYAKYFSINLKSQMQYKGSFFATFIGQFFCSFVSVVAIFFMFNRFHIVDDFTLAESLLCFAVVNIGFSLSETFARGFDTFPISISNGEFDRILVRPRNIIFQMLAFKMEFARLGKVIQSILVLVFAIATSDVIWSATKVITLIFMIISSSVVFMCLFILYAGVAFFTIEGIEFMNIFTYGGKEFGQYPYSIYGKGVLGFLTFVIPLATFQYYPFLYLSGRETSLFYMFIPILGIIFAIPCIAFWKFGVRHYKSTGS